MDVIKGGDSANGKVNDEIDVTNCGDPTNDKANGDI